MRVTRPVLSIAWTHGHRAVLGRKVCFGIPAGREVPMTRLHSCSGSWAVALLTATIAMPALAAETVPFKEGVQMPAQPPGITYEEATPPLFTDLGTLSWK